MPRDDLPSNDAMPDSEIAPRTDTPPRDVVELLSQLVATPSVNPMGRPLTGDQYYEHQLTDYLARFFQQLGLAYERHTIAPRRDNILARLDGGTTPPEQGGPLLLWEAHQDTVPVDGMTIEPWTPTVRDGRLYGRGACDIKGGMAAMLWALSRLAAERPSEMPTIIMACTVNEEFGFTGATALARLWDSGTSQLLTRRPDAAIVAEPTELQVVVAHKGTLRWRLHTLGRAAHSSYPQQGDNALYKMGRVLAALERYAQHLAQSVPAHPLCGGATLSVGTIQGGLSVNTVPDRCTIEIDRRLLPGESAAEALAEAVGFIERHTLLGSAIVHDPPFLQAAPLDPRLNHDLAEQLGTVAESLAGAKHTAGQGRRVGVAYGTNAGRFADVGTPSVVFGPGSIAQAHTVDEWLSLDQLHRATEVLVEFARQGKLARSSST